MSIYYSTFGLPIENLELFFDIKAIFRIKRSGSTHAAKKDIDNIINYLQTHNYNIYDCQYTDQKLLVKSKDNLTNQIFIIDNTEYMFSSKEAYYEVRRLSNTFNANVIFSIKLKKNVHSITPNQFINLLKNL